MQRYFTEIKTSRATQAVTLAALLIVVNGLLYVSPIYRAIGAAAVLTINNLTNVVTALFSVWLGFRLWHSSRHGESIRVVWGCLTTGLVLWVLAEIAWDVYQVLRGIDTPTSSPADIAWMLGYLAVIAGLILRVYTFRMRPTKAWQFGMLVVYGLLAVLACLYIIFPLLNVAQHQPSGTEIVELFYAVCDLVLGFLAILLVLVLEGGLLSKPWATIALACLCVAFSNLLYAYTLSNGIFQVDPVLGPDLLSALVDTFYTFAYVLMALGLYLQARLLEAI